MNRMNLVCGVAAAALLMTVAQAACAQDAPSPPPAPESAYALGRSVAAPGFHQHDGFSSEPFSAPVRGATQVKLLGKRLPLAALAWR